MISIFLGTEDVTISAFLPLSHVTLCHQNLAILTTSLPPPSGDVIFEWPLTLCTDNTVSERAYTRMKEFDLN